MKITENPLLHQNKDRFHKENEEKMEEESFNFQSYYESESKMPQIASIENRTSRNPRKKTRGSFKNAYINKLNSLLKDSNNKHTKNEENIPDKYTNSEILNNFTILFLKKKKKNFNGFKIAIP